MLLPSEWAAIWYRCLICHRCFQFPDKLIAHRKNTSCGIKYLDLHLDDSTSTSSTSEEEDEQERQESSSSSSGSDGDTSGYDRELKEDDSTKINDTNIPSTATPHTNYENEPVNTFPTPQSQNFEDVVNDTILLGQTVLNCDFQGQLLDKENVDRPYQSIQNSCAVNEEEDEEDNDNAVVVQQSNINPPSIPFSESSIPVGGYFFCKFCYQELDSLKELGSHIRHHREDEKVYKCYFCSVTFKTLQYITAHLRVHTKEKPFKCTFCKIEFNQQQNMSSHQKKCSARMDCSGIVKKSSIFVKTVTCNKPSTANGLKVHTELNEFPKNLTKKPKCKICGKTFKLKTSLRLHMNVHSKTNPYKCQKCGKMARDSHDLKQHMDTNSCRETANPENLTPKNLSKKPNPNCKICGKNFKLQASLSAHMYLHSKTNPYKCKNCGKMLRSTAELKRHFNNSSCRIRANGGPGATAATSSHTTIPTEKKLNQGPSIWIRKKGTTSRRKKGTLSRRKKVANTGVKKWECFCKKGSRQLECLVVRTRKIGRHNPHLKCTKCGHVFRQLRNLKRHLENESCPKLK